MAMPDHSNPSMSRARRAPVVTGVSLQPNGELMSIVGDDHRVAIFDLKEDKFIDHLTRHQDWVRAAKFNYDGTRLASAGNDRRLLVWDATDWRTPLLEKRHPEAIIDIAFTEDGSKLATVGFSKTLRIYDTVTGNQFRSLRCACDDNHAVAFSKDGTLIAAGGRCGTVRVWSTNSGQVVSEFKAHRKRIRSLEFTSEGKIISGGDDQTVRITDARQSRPGWTLPRHDSKLYDIKMLPGGLLSTAGSDNKIHVWQLSGAELVGSLKGHTGTVTCLDLQQEKLASGSYDTQVRVWTMEQNTSFPQQRTTNSLNRNPGGSSAGWNRKLK